MKPENNKEKIKAIVDKFGLYNKRKKEGNFLQKVVGEPSVILTRLLVKYKNEKLSEEDILNYLEKRLEISREKAQKLKEELDQEIFSKETASGKKEEKQDRYREAIE